MSRLTDLIAQSKAKDAALGQEVEREFRVLSSRRSFGLNFERHRPESVELPGRPIRKGEKVHILPERGSTAKGDQRLWKVMALRIAEFATIRLRLIKVAARIIETGSRIRVALASACPDAALFPQITLALRAASP